MSYHDNPRYAPYVPAHPTECPDCRGLGYTLSTATEFLPATKDRPYVTVKQGSGCARCGGTGRMDARPRSL